MTLHRVVKLDISGALNGKARSAAYEMAIASGRLWSELVDIDWCGGGDGV